MAQSPQPLPGVLTIASGQLMVLELETPLHTRKTKKGAAAYFRTVDDVMDGGRVVIPQGSSVRATVTQSKRAGRIKGRAELQLRLDELKLAEGTTLALNAGIVRAGSQATSLGEQGSAKVKGEAGGGGKSVVSGGLQGVILGSRMGVKGVLYGGAAGAGIGLASIILERGPDVDLPQGTMFEARFDRPLQVSAAVAQKAVELAAPRTRIRIADARPPDFGRSQEPRFRLPDDVDNEPPPATVNPSTQSDAPVDLLSSRPPDTAADSAGFRLSMKVQLVLVDTVVHDPMRHPMENLNKEDFRIFEEGIEQQIQEFSRDLYPLAVALVIDRSGSVAPFMNEIRDAAYHALMQLKSGDQVCLFSFASRVDRLEDLTTDRQRIADSIATIRAGGGTDIIDALHDAVQYLSMVAPRRRRAVILVSDNQGTVRPKVSEGETIRLAMETETVIYSVKTAASPVPIALWVPTHLIGMGSVRKVTEQTGGEIIEAAGSGLDAALGAAVLRLKRRYTLGYYPPEPSAGNFRRIEVRLTEPYGRPGTDYTVHSRTGYYASAAGARKGNQP